MAHLHVVHFTRLRSHYSIERVYDDVRSALPTDVRVTTAPSRHPSRGFLPRLRAALEARAHSADVNHVTGDVHFLVYFLPKNQTVLTIHDCGRIEQTAGLRGFLLWLFWLWLPEKRCTRLVAISHETKRRILTHLSCDPEKITVIPNPVSPAFYPTTRAFNEGQPRILHVGTKPHKNLERLVEALVGLDVLLVVIGSLSTAQARNLEDSGINWINRQGLSQGELHSEYAACDMVAFVSTEEGFGLPVVEAQAVGKPLLTSRKAPMDEIAGDGAVLVDPFDPREIREGIQGIISDHALRERIVAAGFRNVERFDRRTVAEKYAELYREVAKPLQNKGGTARASAGVVD